MENPPSRSTGSQGPGSQGTGSGAALLLIDCQRDFWTPEHEAVFPGFPDAVARLLSLCRREGIEVIHVRSRFAPDRSDWMPPYRHLGSIPCVAGTEGEEVLPFAAEIEGERVFLKQTLDALQAPELVEHLHGSGTRTVLVAGLETSFCVLLTGASATQAGYWTGVVADAVADDPEIAGQRSPLEIYAGKLFFPLRLDQVSGFAAKQVVKKA